MKTKIDSEMPVERRPGSHMEKSRCSQTIGMRGHKLPTQMIVAIDGWAQSGKNTAGELVAEAIGAVLLDSGRLYRAITKACLDAGIDLNSSKAIGQFCEKITLEV